MIYKYRKFFLLFLLFFAVPLFAQNASQPWWLSLEQGKIKFRSRDYGDALMLFEDARRNRRAMYEQMERDLISFLSLNEVRRIGDSLEILEKYAKDRYHTAASAALEELFYRIPKASLNNSANAALNAIGKLKNYPEAEYWIGEVYRVEGELSLALSQFRRAYEMRESLEDPGFATALLYKISNILLTRREYNEMERTLLSIIAENDTLWASFRRSENDQTQTSSFISQAMTRTLENDGIGRFMELYRYNNSAAEQAHRLLGFYYAASGRPSAQQHLMFAFLIQNTIIIEEVTRRQFDFTFTDLAALAQEINRNSLLLSYVEETEYYRTIYYLSASLYRNGRTSAARNFWEFLASQPQAGEWHNRAVMQIRNPLLEPIIELP
ncbi:MAG: hypothetical protein LBI12_02030 [Treponema sp.]|jgi:tetratricopeptide (TPR) repeat protein|nr:hypothetical protein [Treponema sp.]